MTNTVKLGAHGPTVSRIGIGCMGMSGIYGATDDATGIATIQAAVDRGVTLVDTGDFYGSGHNERLVGRALAGRREKVTLSVKFGAMRAPGGHWLGVDGRPNAVKNFCAYSLDRLGVDHIDVYRLSRLDPQVPIEDTVGAVAELVKSGHVKHVGLSEVSAETIRRAAKVHPISDVQLEYALVTRKPETTIFPTLHELGISATLYGIYSRGLLTGSKPATKRDSRGWFPRFSAENATKNDAVVAALDRFAGERGLTKAQLLVGYVLAKQPSFVALPGPRTIAQLEDALAALESPLSADDVAALEKLVPSDAIAGDRYGADAMRSLDSER